MARTATCARARWRGLMWCPVGASFWVRMSVLLVSICAGQPSVFASGIAVPEEPELDQGAQDRQMIRAPGQVDEKQTRETQADRLERLYRSGVRQRPQPPIATDYLSVLREKTEKEGVLPNLPPELQFSFGFGSWFPLAESDGRTTQPLGAHHVEAMLLSFGEDRVTGRYSDPLRSSWGRLSLLAVSVQGEAALPGVDRSGRSVRSAVLFNDLEFGADGAFVWQRPLGDWGQLEWSLGLAYLPLRIRQILNFGHAKPEDDAFRENGFKFNPSGGHLRVSLSYVLVHLFAVGAFSEVGAADPQELRLRVGLQVGLRSPHVAPPQEESSADSLPFESFHSGFSKRKTKTR
jgi:hypothetical protein